jgi:uncharacterized membrane protein
MLALLGMGAAVVLVEVDSRLGFELGQRWPRLFGVGAEGARGLLETVAGSMITVAGVAFSITIVALSLAANQYSPRVLRNFMKDRTNQLVLGVFVGIHVYCLVVLRTIRSGENGSAFVPSLAVTTGVLLALVGIGFLILFIHHIATSMQVSHILSVAASDTMTAVRRTFTSRAKAGTEPTPAADIEEAASDASLDRHAWREIPATHTGYVQAVDVDGLLALAEGCDLVCRMACGPGAFVVAETPLLTVTGSRADDEALVGRFNKLYAIGRERTVEHDPAFGVRQIVDIALKALSPGIHDPTTATEALDHLRAIFIELGQRPDSPRDRLDTSGQVRLVVVTQRFAPLLTESVEAIRHSAAGNVMVLSALLALLVAVGRAATVERRPLVRDEMLSLRDTITRTVKDPRSLAALTTDVSRALSGLSAASIV